MVKLTETGRRVREAGEESGSILEIFTNLLRSAPTESDSESKVEPLPLTRFPVLEVTEVATPSIARRFAEVKRPQRTEMTSMEPALREVINNERIMVTPEMIPFINDPDIIVDDLGLPARRMRSMSSRQFERQAVLPKKKRKVSKYQKEFGRQLKMLKKKFPRTPVTKLMKRAHAATRKALK